jgi:hypothetical protein
MPPAWQEAVAEYAAMTGGEAIALDAGHYLHVERPAFIAGKSRSLIEETLAD